MWPTVGLVAAIRRPTSHLVVSKAVRAQVRRKQVFQSTVPFPYWLSKIDWMKLDLWPVNYSDKIYIWLFLLHRTKEIQGAGIINLSRRYFRHHRGGYLPVSCQVACQYRIKGTSFDQENSLSFTGKFSGQDAKRWSGCWNAVSWVIRRLFYWMLHVYRALL